MAFSALARSSGWKRVSNKTALSPSNSSGVMANRRYISGDHSVFPVVRSQRTLPMCAMRSAVSRIASVRRRRRFASLCSVTSEKVTQKDPDSPSMRCRLPSRRAQR